MKKPSILQFSIQKGEDSGYIASAVGFSIYTQGETLDELVDNIKEATECYFEEIEVDKTPVPIMVNFALPAAI